MNKKLILIPLLILSSRFGRRYPIRVMHFCTFRCNLHCKYCGIWKTLRYEMTTKEIKNAMKEFSDAGTVFWTFTGGEPLLRKDISELVDYAKSLFPIVSLTTNGFLLKDNIDKVKNVNYFTISLDGPKEVTDKTRGRGTYDKVIESIQTARKIGKDVVINSVISEVNIKNNFRDLMELIKLAEDLRCKLNFSIPYKDQFNTKRCLEEDIDLILPSKKEKIAVLTFLKKIKREKPNFIMFSDPCIEILKELKKWKKCYSGILFCDLFPDGTVANCLFKEKDGVNGLEFGFQKAFKKLSKIENCYCSSTCYNELNCIFSLKPKSVMENFVKYISYTK